MAYLVTGANGFIGSRLCHSLATAENDVVGLCRGPTDNPWLTHPQIRIAIGDLSDRDSIIRAMTGCGFCFHLAGFAKQWSRDRSEFFRINVTGTRNVLEAAMQTGIARIVHTSTAGVMGPSSGPNPLDETSAPSSPVGTDYETTKIEAEQIVLQAAENGLDTCIVNPTRVFGPGPLTESNSLTRIMSRVAAGKWRWIPGNGNSVGNYVFIDDVIHGHVLAMNRGERGQRYLLGGDNLSFNELFRLIQQHSRMRRPMVHVPRTAIMAFSRLQQARANVFGVAPMLTPAFARRYFADCLVSSGRARRELGFTPGSVSDGVQATMNWLRES